MKKADPEFYAKKAAKHKEKYQSRREAGMCVQCGKRQPKNPNHNNQHQNRSYTNNI
jgi:hypothetical protein